jgi:hypothetical protein
MKRKVALGPGAASLILIVVVLSLCMLGMLMQIGSRNDYSLTTRSTEMISRVYDLSARSERRLAELDAVLVSCRQEAPEQEAFLASVAERLPEGMEIQEDEVSWKEPLDNRTLICVVRLLGPDHPERTEWISHKLIVEEPEEEWE